MGAQILGPGVGTERQSRPCDKSSAPPATAPRASSASRPPSRRPRADSTAVARLARQWCTSPVRARIGIGAFLAALLLPAARASADGIRLGRGTGNGAAGIRLVYFGDDRRNGVELYVGRDEHVDPDSPTPRSVIGFLVVGASPSAACDSTGSENEQVCRVPDRLACPAGLRGGRQRLDWHLHRSPVLIGDEGSNLTRCSPVGRRAVPLGEAQELATAALQPETPSWR